MSIAVPTPFHHAIAKDFLRKGIDVLLEKPISTTLEEADELIELAESHGRILQIGHLERFSGPLLALEGVVQDPMFIESNRLGPFLLRGTEVDVVLDLMIHDIDIILSWVPSKVKWFHAVGIPVLTSHIDIANVRVEFENGCTANLTASRVSREKMRKIRLFQPTGYLSIDFLRQKAILAGKKKEEGKKGLPGIFVKKFPVRKVDPLKMEIRIFSPMRADPGNPPGLGERWKAGPGARASDCPEHPRSRRQESDRRASTRMKTKKILMVAGETSGDLHGAHLMEAIQKIDPGVEFFGLGGEALAQGGMRLLYHHRTLSVVGITEVLVKLKTILQVLRGLKRALPLEKPDLAILIDFPDFNLRLAKSVYRQGIPILYYISPQVWAWRASRVKVIARWVRKMIVFFPFEVPLYRAEGVDVEWVGHPLVESVKPSLSREEAFARVWSRSSPADRGPSSGESGE